MYCRHCGKEIANEAVVCIACGCPPKTGTKFCQNCGVETTSFQEVCTKCGVKLANQFSDEQKSKLVAGLLGLFFGALGVHRFYLGYTTIGIIQIVVTIVTFGIGALWGFVEGILILAGSMNKDAKGNYLKE